MKHYSQRNWITGSIFLFCLAAINPAQAQIASDNTLSTTVNTPDNRNFTITNGTQAGSNLFHSFSEFSIPTGGSASFAHLGEIQNIISRVTGSSISNIDGLIQANGSANLFLLNPNGIIFGPNASLNIGGSFLASTASSLRFPDGKSFSATAPQATPLLLVSVPIGLQFGKTAGSIINQSQAINSNGESVSLQVKPGKTLALVGGAVTLDGGHLTAAGGRIELGSVAGSADVKLNSTPQGLALNYKGVQNFQDIKLSELALADASGSGGGEIQVRGRNITLSGGSKLLSNTLGSLDGGDVTVNASDSLQLLGTTTVPDLYEPVEKGFGIIVPLRSAISTNTSNAGKAGNVMIRARQLIVRDGAQITAASFIPGTGKGGNVTVKASQSVEVTGTSVLPDGQGKSPFSAPGFDDKFFIEFNSASTLATTSGTNGAAGNLTINTRKLTISNGGLVTANPFGGGAGGNLTVKASESLDLIGTSANGVFPSGVFTSAFGTGAAGNLTVDTEKLSIQNGAQISASTFAAGQGGNLNVNASNSVEVIGSGSGLFTQTRGAGSAGELTIETEKLSVQDGAEVAVSSQGQGSGNASDLKVRADSILLDTQGKLSATTDSGKEGGDIKLEDLDLLIMRRNSKISTNAGGTGNGGNINIDTKFLVAAPLEDSDISANAGEGRGGRVEINSQGIFGIESHNEPTLASDITATSQQGPQFNGVVDINTLDIDPSGGLVTLPVEVVDISRLIAQGCQVGGRQGLSKFVVTGRGGLPPNPRQTLNNDTVLADLGTSVQESKNQSSAVIPTISPSPPKPVIEAQGWVLNSKGNVVLTAQAHNVTPQSSGLPTPSCGV